MTDEAVRIAKDWVAHSGPKDLIHIVGARLLAEIDTKENLEIALENEKLQHADWVKQDHELRAELAEWHKRLGPTVEGVYQRLASAQQAASTWKSGCERLEKLCDDHINNFIKAQDKCNVAQAALETVIENRDSWRKTSDAQEESLGRFRRERDELNAKIAGLESELEILKNPSDGRCMEIGALRRQRDSMTARFDELEQISREANRSCIKAMNERDSFKARANLLFRALDNLLLVKDHKDKNGKTEWYAEWQPKAWAVAREAIAGFKSR